MRKKNILYVTCYLDVSGVTIINYEILRRLLPEFRILVITTEPDPGGPTWETEYTTCFEKPVKLWQIPAAQRMTYFVTYLKDNSIDIIYTTHSLWLYENVALLKKIIPEIVVIDSLHTLEPYYLRGGFPDISANKHVHKYLDRTILISNNLLNYIVSYYEIDLNKMVVIRNGIDTSKFSRNNIRSNTFRDELGVSRETKIIGFIGRLVHQKRPLLFLSAASDIAKKIGEGAHFYVIGDGRLKSRVISYAKKHLYGRFSFFEKRSDIDNVLCATDLLLVTSSYEGAPLTILEALALDVPVVASDVGAIREYFENSISYVAPFRVTEKGSFVERALFQLKGCAQKTSLPPSVWRTLDIETTVQRYGNVFRMSLCDNITD